MALTDFRRVLDALSALVFDHRCVACGAAQGPVCAACRGQEKAVVYPCRRCGQPTGVSDTVVSKCSECRGRRLHFQKARSLFLYTTPWDEVIRRAKFEGEHAVLREVKGPWQAFCVQELAQQPTATFTWVPPQADRQRERSITVSEQLARWGAAALDRPAVPLLVKARPTPPQMGLGLRERSVNIKGAFAVSRGSLQSQVWPADIVLVDDVYTTGHTVNECSRALRTEGTKDVTVLTLARVSMRF